ncbi:anthocyanidin 3-O-glucosyltransferase 5-like [Prosopis cineraria]|uniref:anthocyanidin 3-O-glucosyltransferase 5-like n=1 Tax=Prosopis cineraria TaxID=364024 RepID=UPI00240ED441|nr:anthocyanidin 3-O-glucosyltransferase 5-like [Prosopis cineraria]
MRETRALFVLRFANIAPPPCVLIVDIFGSECLSWQKSSACLSIFTVASNAWFFSLLCTLPSWIDKCKASSWISKNPSKSQVAVQFVPKDVVDPMLNRNTRLSRVHRPGDGDAKKRRILLNTWEQLQHRGLRSLRDENLLGGMLKVPVYAIGPLVRPSEPPTSSTMELLGWLDQQPSESVVLRVVWQRWNAVVRADRRGGLGYGVKPTEIHLEGFAGRTHKVGKLVAHWAAQVSILRHPSVGDFCRIVVELRSGEHHERRADDLLAVIYAEQRMNATLLAEELGVGVRPKVLPAEKVVGREEWRGCLRDIMEVRPNPVRDRARELKESAAMAVKRGGSSYTTPLTSSLNNAGQPDIISRQSIWAFI